jgi:hypothetical protein
MKMKRRKRTILKVIVIGAVIALVTSVFSIYMLGEASGYLLIRGLVWFAGKDIQHGQVRLLYKTDHQALLDACKELSKRVATGDMKAGRYYLRGGLRLPVVSGFPKPILDLEPNYVYIDENDSGRVMVEMGGGFAHFGVLAYTEDYKKPSWAKYGDKQLIEGLWYYDEGYDQNAEYDKIIEALRPKGQ